MQSKVRIQMGLVQLEYEGPETFLKKDLLELLAKIADLNAQIGGPATEEDDDPPAKKVKGKATKPVQATTGTIASNLKCKSGTVLVLAAAAHLTCVANKGTFSRGELLTAMKTATHYYKKSYSNNLSTTLRRLIDGGKLIETSSGVYALSEEEKTTLEKTLGK